VAPNQISSRNAERIAGIVAAILLSLLFAGSWVYLYRVDLVVIEKVLIGGLFSGIGPVQSAAIRGLREHRTRHAAIALVVFINLKHFHGAPANVEEEPAEEERRRGAQKREDLEFAGRALESLCLIADDGFGTSFRNEARGRSWDGIPDQRWPAVLGNVNAWALQSFGPDMLFALSAVGVAARASSAADKGTPR